MIFSLHPCSILSHTHTHTHTDRINTTHFPTNDSGTEFRTPFEQVYGKHSGISLPSLVGDGGTGSASDGELRKEGEMGTLEVLSANTKSEEERLIITGYDIHVQLCLRAVQPQLSELATSMQNVWILELCHWYFSHSWYMND